MTILTLRKAMRMLDKDEPWTVGAEDGEGWIFYFDGKELHDGSRNGLTLDALLDRECLSVYQRDERKNWKLAKLPAGVMELEAGLAFVVAGNEYGDI